jgi:hypothetical protein
MPITVLEVVMRLVRRIFLPFLLILEYILIVLLLIAVDYCEFGRGLRSI